MAASGPAAPRARHPAALPTRHRRARLAAARPVGGLADRHRERGDAGQASWGRVVAAAAIMHLAYGIGLLWGLVRGPGRRQTFRRASVVDRMGGVEPSTGAGTGDPDRCPQRRQNARGADTGPRSERERRRAAGTGSAAGPGRRSPPPIPATGERQVPDTTDPIAATREQRDERTAGLDHTQTLVEQPCGRFAAPCPQRPKIAAATARLPAIQRARCPTVAATVAGFSSRMRTSWSQTTGRRPTPGGRRDPGPRSASHRTAHRLERSRVKHIPVPPSRPTSRGWSGPTAPSGCPPSTKGPRRIVSTEASGLDTSR